MRGFILGLIVGILLVPTAAYYYVRSGKAPVATFARPMPMERKLASEALHARVDREAPKTAPIKADVANLAAGARVYVQNCSSCHGLADHTAPAIAQGMFPHPPQFFTHHEHGTGARPGPIFWIAQNGIRLSGMPAFRNVLSDNQLWQVTVMLVNTGKLPASVQGLLSGRASTH
jgi:thiosulfate dehydrogenase